MDNKIKITVIVPAYNVGKWIPRCIESICAQTYNNIEILLIDDGSTDETPKIIDEYAKKDKRIVPIHQKNAGLVAVREVGIEMAQGEYVGFVDGDDEIEPDMYERLLKNALKYHAEISQCGILYCFYDGRKKPMHGTGEVYLFDRKEGYRELMQGTIMEPSLCNKLYKKDLLCNSCLDINIINNEDLLRNSVLFGRVNNSVFEDFCGYHYWRREDSMSNNKNSVQNSKHILKARKLILKTTDLELKKFAVDNYMAAVFAVYNSLVGNRQKDAVELKKKCKKILYEYRKDISNMRTGIRLRGYAIQFIPLIYDFIYKIHIKLLYARIKRESKN